MSDITRYSRERAARDPEFAEGLEPGYAEFKVGALLREAREQAGLTQEEVAERLETKKSAISRIENSAGSIRLSTLERFARAIGWELTLELKPPQKATTGKRVASRSKKSH
jgi:HTH-type transcriptional regulator/antitoxin HipB